VDKELSDRHKKQIIRRKMITQIKKDKKRYDRKRDKDESNKRESDDTIN